MSPCEEFSRSNFNLNVLSKEHIEVDCNKLGVSGVFVSSQANFENRHCLSFQLAAHVPSCTWILVYSTFQHGMSLSTLYHRVREVETPVLLVVKDNNGFVSNCRPLRV